MLHFVPLIFCYVKKNNTKHRDALFLSRVHDLILKNINNEECTIPVFCREIGLSGTQFRRKMKAMTGLSPNRFIRLQRLKTAARLIKYKQMNVSEAAYQAGFSHMSYFCKCFKKEYGILPSQY